MRVSTSARSLSVLVLVSNLLTACTGATTPAPSTVATAAPSGGSTAPASVAPKGELPKPEVTSLRLGFSAGGEMSQFAGNQASILKIFDKYGISTTVTGFEGDGRTVAAMQAGQIDVGFTGSGSALSSQLGDAPVVIIAISATILTDDLVCAPAVKAAADVKGKKIAISTFGGTSNASALLALKALNLSAADATITQVGGQAARIAAVKGGSADCAVVDKVQAPDMIAAGLNIVASIWKPPVQPFGRSGMSVTKKFAAANPNTTLVAVAAVLEAQNLIWTDSTGTAQRFATWLQTTPDKALPLVTDFQAVGNRSMMWKDEAFINSQKVIAAVNPDIIDVKVTDAFDRQYLQKLLDTGFYAKINNPATTPGP